jgi:transcriptional regulator NrdR family protein
VNSGIPCPICGPTRWEVLRTTAQVNRVRRERRCMVCGYRLDTEERAIEIPATGSKTPTKLASKNDSEPLQFKKGQNHARRRIENQLIPAKTAG